MPSREVLWANIQVGADALRIHPMRTMLSVLGITIGSAALVATMAVSDGMMQFARDKVLRETSVQVLIVSPRTSKYEDGEWVALPDYPTFTMGDVQAIRAGVEGVRAATLVLGGRTTARYRNVQQRVDVTLGTSAIPDFGTLDMGAGRFFSDAEVARNVPVVVINHALARELAPTRDPFAMVGQEIRVNERTRRVVGVLAPAEFENPESPSFTVYAPIRAARSILAPGPGGRFAPSIQLLAPDLESVTAIEASVIEWLTRRYGRWQDRVRVTLALEQLRQVEQAFLLIKLFIGTLVGISLLVGGIGIMNVLLASVSERTREIGIRKSVGARSSDIRAQFLTESVAIALVGACTGLAIGLGIAFGITALFRVLAHVPVYPVLSVASVLIATLSSSIVGLVFGTYPARRAASLSPVVAIAQE